MPSWNKATVAGHLGADPEIQYTPGGAAVLNLSLASNEKWKDKEGNLQEHTEWHKIVCWNKLAETCAQYLHKGDPVMFEGKLKTDKWQDKDGNDRYTTKIVAREMMFMGRGKDGGSNSDSQPPSDDDNIPF